jgi:hypothetical protein
MQDACQETRRSGLLADLVEKGRPAKDSLAKVTLRGMNPCLLEMLQEYGCHVIDDAAAAVDGGRDGEKIGNVPILSIGPYKRQNWCDWQSWKSCLQP